MLLVAAVAIALWLYRPVSPRDTAAQRVPAQSTARPDQDIGSVRPRATVAESAAGEASVSAVEAEATLSISGSVLNQQGQRLADVGVFATARRVFESERASAGPATRSDAAGRYAFDGLEQGDYVIRSEETALYPSASIKVRSGSSEADLVLAARQELWVHGRVTEGDAPLRGVNITPDGQPMNITYSDSDGQFGLFIALDGGDQRQDTLLFSLQGYSDERLILQSSDRYATELALADVRLTRIGGKAAVRGSVIADDAPVARASVVLRSIEHSNHYETSSDPAGQFVMPQVIFGDYSLLVLPAGTYRDHAEDRLTVGAAGLDLHIELEPLQNARLRGRMTDMDGNAVPGFSLWLTSMSARGQGSRELVGDAEGLFELSEIPVGEVALATRSEPRMLVSGVTVSGSDNQLLELTLDVGDQMLEGRVLDNYSNALPGAHVSLIWAHETNGITSHAARLGISDTSGYFRFAQLGPGMHTLNVRAPGFGSRRIEHDVSVGGELQIELDAR